MPPKVITVLDDPPEHDLKEVLERAKEFRRCWSPKHGNEAAAWIRKLVRAVRFERKHRKQAAHRAERNAKQMQHLYDERQKELEARKDA